MNKENIIQSILKHPLYKFENNSIFSINQCMEYIKNNVDTKIYLDYISSYKNINTISSLSTDKMNFINNIYYLYPYSLWYSYTKTNIATLLEITKNWYNILVDILFNYIRDSILNIVWKYDYIVIVPQSINRKYNILINIEKMLEDSWYNIINVNNNIYYPAIKNIRKLDDKLSCSLKKFNIDDHILLKDNDNIY